jgi:hypothetical protein
MKRQKNYFEAPMMDNNQCHKLVCHTKQCADKVSSVSGHSEYAEERHQTNVAYMDFTRVFI